MAAIRRSIKRYALPIYFILTFVISWGGILLVIGPDGLLGTAAPDEGLLPLIYAATLAGPTIAGLLLTGLADGRAGLRSLLSRLLTWRVAPRWYAVALLTAPLLLGGTLAALSLISPAYLPGILTVDDKAALLLTGLIAGLMVGLFEELGWTGFAVPRLRKRHSILFTGLVVGILWGIWHFPLFSGSRNATGAVPFALYLGVLLFSFLPPFRVLMVWVYERTESLLVVMLMHASLTASILILPPQVTGMQVVIYDLVFAAALWIVVAAIALADGRFSFRQPITS